MNKTPNYQLNQWEASDKVQRVDFNADNAKIDAALGTLTEFMSKDRTAYGTYEGDSSMELRTVPLPWEPKLVILMGKVNSNSAVAFLTRDTCLYSTGLSYNFISGTYSPKIQGSALVLEFWFNIGTTYYIAFR